MGRLSDWWNQLSRRGSRPAAHRPPAEARFTEIGTNYPGAGSSPTLTWSAPNPYAAFDPRGSTPSGSRPSESGTPAWGTPSSATGSTSTSTAATATATSTATSSATATTSVPTSQFPVSGAAARRRAGRRARAKTATGFGVIAVIVVVVVFLVIGFVAGSLDDAGSGDRGGPPGGYAPELEADWTLDSYALSQDYGTFDSADGTLPGEVLETSTGWVTMIEPSTLESQLLSVEPTSGEVQWITPMPEARCTLSGEALLCLTRAGGSEFQLVTVAADTGEPVGEPVATDLTHVPVFVAPMGAAGLVTMSMDAELTGLDLQGTTLWSQSIDLGDHEAEWLSVDVVQYESSAIVSLGWPVGTVHASAEGGTLHACDGVAAVPEAWMCLGEDEAVGYSPTGDELWRGDWSDYYLVDQYQRIAPVMLVDNWDGTVSGIEPLTGDHGPAIRISDEDDFFNFLGDAEHPFVFAEASVSMLDPELTTVLWTTSIDDEYLNIAGGGVVGDILAIDAEHSYGLDLATGEMRWERAFLAYDALVVGDAFVGVQINDLMRYSLP